MLSLLPSVSLRMPLLSSLLSSCTLVPPTSLSGFRLWESGPVAIWLILGSWGRGLVPEPRPGGWPWPGLVVEDWVLFLVPGPVPGAMALASWSFIQRLVSGPGAADWVLFLELGTGHWSWVGVWVLVLALLPGPVAVGLSWIRWLFP